MFKTWYLTYIDVNKREEKGKKNKKAKRTKTKQLESKISCEPGTRTELDMMKKRV